jgi:hypothetical protein
LSTFNFATMNEMNDTISNHLQDSVSRADSSSLYQFFVHTGHSLLNTFGKNGAVTFKGDPIAPNEQFWQFSFLIGMLMMFVILKSFFGNRMNLFLSAVTDVRQLRLLMREENFLFHPFSILLLVNAAVIYSMIGFAILDFYNLPVYQGTGLAFYLLFSGIILAIMLIKIIILRMMEFFTDTDLGQRENRYTWILFHQFGGLVLLPVAAIMLFGKPVWLIPGVWITAFLLFIFLIFRIAKGFRLALNNGVLVLHLILYLCALEIIPLIVLIKVLVTRINGLTE